MLLAMLAGCQLSVCHAQSWPAVPQEAKPYTRWWWLGSAVTDEGLRWNLEEMQKAGIGGVEITPIYGVQGNEAHDIQYLSPQWMKMLRTTEQLGGELGIEVDMATGTGWPFGGPAVPRDEAACKLNDDGTVGRTMQKVKRAAPGGEGLVIDHFDATAVRHYLDTFDHAFQSTSTPFPHTFFNDSYEVYNADWTPKFLDEFEKKRGYSLLSTLQKTHGGSSDDLSVLNSQWTPEQTSDYRETLGELLLDNFTNQWTDWAHRHGAITRNQAHGSPANLIDIYAAVDIPECEGFGLSDFGIKGLRTDAGFTKKNDSDLSMLKYASSAAHITGKRFTSSETFTWLTEHFRTSLSQCKPDFDLMMVAGVNHIVFHGSAYSPQDEEWPGWRFYASVDMTPANNWWTAMPAFSRYIQRVQTFMQMGEPDNDVLVYLPYYDMIHDLPGRLVQFDIHHMAERAPQFIQQVNSIIHAGYDCDYVSDKYLLKLETANGLLRMRHDGADADDAANAANTAHAATANTGNAAVWKAVVVPNVRYMPLETLQHLFNLSKQGANIVFIGSLPQMVPGHGRQLTQTKPFLRLLKKMQKTAVVATDASRLNDLFGIQPETMRTRQGLSLIRRADAHGHHYFISNLQGRDIDEWVTLATSAQTATFYNPMNGDITRCPLTHDADGSPRLRLQLRSGESIILVTSDNGGASVGDNDAGNIPTHTYRTLNTEKAITLTGWTLSFPQAAPVAIADTFSLVNPCSWTTLGNPTLNETMATGRYNTRFMLPQSAIGSDQPTVGYMLDLGDVRETAIVTVNGQVADTLFAVPYLTDVTRYLKPGENTITVDVANLPANRIAALDRQGVKWRKMKEINVVDLNYKTTTYADWEPVPSGLCSAVTLIPFNL